MKPELCKGCPLENVGTGYVEGEGPDDATTLLLGEALGAEEVSRGRPFIGGAGRVLNNLLRRAGVARSSLYITNVVRCRPPKNRTPSEAEIRECTTRHDLATLLKRFNLIVPLGNSALFAVAGETHISRWRGSVFQKSDLKILPTFHPAAVMRQQDMIPVVIADLQKIGTEGWTSDYIVPVQNYERNATLLHMDKLSPARPIAFDVETKALEPSEGSIVLCGLCQQPTLAYVLDDKEFYSAIIKERLQTLLGSGAPKIGHNIIFDIRHMNAQGIRVKPPWFDTMIAHHLTLSDTPNDLGFVSSLYTRIPYWKHLAKVDPQWYCATDVDATMQIYTVLNEDIKRKGMTRIFHTSMKVLPILEEMRATGVRVNHKKQLAWKIGLERKIRTLEQNLAKGIGDPAFNWRSHPQLVKLLYEKLQYPRIYSKYSSKVTANEEALKELHELTGSKIVKALLSLRKLSKLSSTYFVPPDTPDGRVHSEYTLHIAANGRTASRGPNLQNVPKGPARAIYIPEDDNIFVAADYNQIELRIAAVCSGDKTLLEEFKQGKDIHTTTAARMYNITPSEVTEHQRFLAKMVVYGLGYGRGALSLARQYKMARAQAQRFIDTYFNGYPRLELWRKDCMSKASADGYLVNPFGRRRYFFGTSIAPKVYNFIPSSTAADILLESILRLHPELPKHTRMVITVHDNILVESPPELEKQVKECVRDIMEKPIDVLDDYVVPVKITSGKTWEECG